MTGNEVCKVPIACLSVNVTGKVSAAVGTAAVGTADMMRNLPVKILFSIGIEEAVRNESPHMKLGAVVVSKSGGQHGGEVQWN